MKRPRRDSGRRETIDTAGLRAAFAERFGELYGEEAAFDDDDIALCTFWDGKAGSKLVYATVGASNKAARSELMLISALPFRQFEMALSDLACAKVRRAPGEIVPCKIDDTPFEAVLFAPPEDGSLAIGEAAWALRLAPLTRAEHLLGRDDPARLLGLLRERGALVADPLRDCALEPGRTRYFRRVVRPMLIDHTRYRLTTARERRDNLAQMNAPDSFVAHSDRLVARYEILLDYLENKAPDAGPDRRSDKLADLFRETLKCSNEMVEGALDPLERLVPESILARFREMLLTILATHPHGIPLVEELAAQTAGVKLGKAREPLAPEVMIDRLAQVVFKIYPDARLADLVERGRSGAAEAMAEFDPKHEIPLEVHVWYHVYTAVYRGLYEPGDPLASAFRHGADSAMLLYDPEDPDDRRPPHEQLPDKLKNIAMAAFLGLAVGAGPRRH